MTGNAIRARRWTMTAPKAPLVREAFDAAPAAVVVVAEVGVADAAAGDLDGDLAGAGRRVELGADERGTGRGHQPAVGGKRHPGSSFGWVGGGLPGPSSAGAGRLIR